MKLHFGKVLCCLASQGFVMKKCTNSVNCSHWTKLGWLTGHVNVSYVTKLTASRGQRQMLDDLSF